MPKILQTMYMCDRAGTASNQSHWWSWLLSSTLASFFRDFSHSCHSLCTLKWHRAVDLGHAMTPWQEQKLIWIQESSPAAWHDFWVMLSYYSVLNHHFCWLNYHCCWWTPPFLFLIQTTISLFGWNHKHVKTCRHGSRLIHRASPRAPRSSPGFIGFSPTQRGPKRRTSKKCRWYAFDTH